MGDVVVLRAEKIEKAYGKHGVLQEVSLEVREGEIVGIAGENGAGKSTLLSLLATIQKPKSGKIYFCGSDIAKGKRAYRKQMGYVPQEIALFEELSGKDNLKFFGKASHVPTKELNERIKAVCEMTGFPEEDLKRPVAEYSGGMRRKINIAAAMLHQPKLLLLDEPVANLDAETEEQVLTVLKQLASQGTSIVYVGHQLDKMEQFCNQICFIKNGKVIRGK